MQYLLWMRSCASPVNEISSVCNLTHMIVTLFVFTLEPCRAQKVEKLKKR
jgi:hypothetical protein